MKKFLILIACISLFGCSRRRNIDLASGDIESIVPDQLWAVVKVSYVALRQEPDDVSEVVFHARSGDLFPVLGKRTVKTVVEIDEKKKSFENRIWYKCEKGWFDDSVVEIYDTKLKAEAAARNRP